MDNIVNIQDTEATEKEIGTWVWPTSDEPGSDGLVIINDVSSYNQ